MSPEPEDVGDFAAKPSDGPVVDLGTALPADEVARLLESEQQYRTLFDSVDVALCIIEVFFDENGTPYDYRFFGANAAFERHTGLREPVGRTIRELVPSIDESWFPIYGNVVVSGTPVRFENHDPALGRWFDAYALRLGPPQNRRVGILFSDITARKRAEDALRRSEQQLREARTRLDAALSAGNIATWSIDLVQNRVTGDARLAYLFSVDPVAAAAGTEPIDKYFAAIHEADRAYAIQATNDTIQSGSPYLVDVRVVLRDGSLRWVSARGTVLRDAEGTPISMVGAVIDLTEQRRTEDRHRARLMDIFRRAPAFMATMHGPEHIFEMANPPYYRLVAHREILGKSVAEALPEVVEQGFVALLDQVYRSGEAYVGTDVPLMLQMEADGAMEERFLDFTYQPLFDDDGTVSGILVHGVDLTERKMLEQERERLLQEERRLLEQAEARAEREALLNQISAAVRASLDPQSILQAAVTTLGKGLGADRCYFVRYSQSRDTARIAPEWIRDGSGLNSMSVGMLRFSSFVVNRDETYRAGRTHVINDVMVFGEDAASLLEVNIRALLRVPVEAGDGMTALSVVMASGPRQWTEDEVRLVENVAGLVRSTLESAQNQQRERNIAGQLQEALQPTAATDVEGLRLASFYRPALAEANVGGDFFDVFNLGNARTALVVADLSGKGLAAATQVSSVRNMLRYALYSEPHLATAVTGLHGALVRHELLTGFATLFAGIFDANEKQLTYVNCGQEPGLIWRASTREVEQLSATGPVLGGFGEGNYVQRTVRVATGDVITLFTDGLTEVGPTRKELLEAEGVSEVLRDCLANETVQTESPEDIKDCLIAGVNDFARGELRDDIALLVGVVTVG